MSELVPNSPGGNSYADIVKLRLAIDEIDEKIMDLINRRLILAKQIGGLKKQSGMRITDSGREKEIINRLLRKNHGPLEDDGLQHIFAAIIAEGRSIQKTDRKPK
jgi:chorismate mutase/prephenate dehydratase